MRSDSRLSILTAADYAKGNLTALAKSGDLPANLPPGLSAKPAYLAHHEGVGGARAYLRDIGEKSATRTSAQMATYKMDQQQPSPSKQRELLAQNGNDPVKAYHSWLTQYVDKAITVSTYTAGGGVVGEDDGPSIATLVRR